MNAARAHELPGVLPTSSFAKRRPEIGTDSEYFKLRCGGPFRYFGARTSGLQTKIETGRVTSAVTAAVLEERSAHIDLQLPHLAHLAEEERNHFERKLVQYYRRCTLELGEEIARLRIMRRGWDLNAPDVDEELQMCIVMLEGKAHALEAELERSKEDGLEAAESENEELYHSRERIAEDRRRFSVDLDLRTENLDRLMSAGAKLHGDIVFEKRRRAGLIVSLKDASQQLSRLEGEVALHQSHNYTNVLNETLNALHCCSFKLAQLEQVVSSINSDFACLNEAFSLVDQAISECTVTELLEEAGNAVDSLCNYFKDAEGTLDFQLNLIAGGAEVEETLKGELMQLEHEVSEQKKAVEDVKSSRAEVEQRVAELELQISAISANLQCAESAYALLEAERLKGSELQKQLQKLKRLEHIM